MLNQENLGERSEEIYDQVITYFKHIYVNIMRYQTLKKLSTPMKNYKNLCFQ